MRESSLFYTIMAATAAFSSMSLWLLLPFSFSLAMGHTAFATLADRAVHVLGEFQHFNQICILHICQVDKFLGDEDKKGLYAWNGFGKVAPAVEG